MFFPMGDGGFLPCDPGWIFNISSILSTYPLHIINSGCGKEGAHTNWSIVMQRQCPFLELP